MNISNLKDKKYNVTFKIMVSFATAEKKILVWIYKKFKII